jgi:xylulokinase
MKAILAGLDIGTSGAKAVLVDEQGRLLAWASQEYAIQMPKADWAEQEASTWLQAGLRALNLALVQSGLDANDVCALGLTGQMHSLVCLDDDGLPLRPAIIWADRRSRNQVKHAMEQLGTQRMAEWTGNPLATGFMLASWLWLCEHEPEVVTRTRYLMLPKDEVRYRLTGKIGSEASDASSTLLFDPHRREWSKVLLTWVGLPVEKLPPLGQSAQVAGYLLPEMAAKCGLRAGIPVIYGCSDQTAQALSQGVVEPGMVSCTIGTGGQLFAPLAEPVHDLQLRLHLFCHALENVWHLEAAILSAGLSLRWLRDQLMPGSNYTQLADSAAQVEAALEGIYFLPYLVGERTPHMDPEARAAFFGLGLHHQRSHLVRAVMEGVVFALRQGLDLMVGLGIPLERLVVSGGGTRHPLWLQLQADIFNQRIYPAQDVEGTARGVAVLAGVGVGVYTDVYAAIRKTVHPLDSCVVPDAHRAEQYATAYQRYCQFYPALKQAGIGSH